MLRNNSPHNLHDCAVKFRGRWLRRSNRYVVHSATAETMAIVSVTPGADFRPSHCMVGERESSVLPIMRMFGFRNTANQQHCVFVQSNLPDFTQL